METADVVICGGGPAGLASALSLARLGMNKIVVLERLPEQWDTDWVKSSCYRLDFHSLKWFQLMEIEKDLHENSVMYSYKNCMISPDNERKIVPRADRIFYNDTYFISRAELLEFLKTQITKKSEFQDKIDLRFNCSVTAVEKPLSGKEDGFVVSVTPKDENAGAYKIRGKLVIGASGARTHVHQAMRDNFFRFRKGVVPYMNVGKRRKAIRLMLPHEVAPTGTMTICSGKDGSTLVIFPQHAHKYRSATCLFKKLDFENGDEFYAYLAENFPWMDWHAVLEKDLAESFATHPGRFTSPVEYSPRLQIKSGSGGACLIGDAVRVAPPCLAQGINSALNDVAALHKAFAVGKEKGSSVAEIIAKYEKDHLRSGVAVAKLMPLGFPYQYPGSANTLHKRFWFWDFNMRKKLNKKFPWLFYGPVIHLLQDPSLSYADVLDRHNATTRNFLVAVTAAAAGAAVVGSWCVGAALKLFRASKNA